MIISVSTTTDNPPGFGIVKVLHKYYLFQYDRSNEFVSKMSVKDSCLAIMVSFLERRTSGTVMLSTLGTMSETMEKKLGNDSKKP